MCTENFYKHLGKNLKCLRKSKGMTQEQLGEQIGLTKSAIVNYETGIRKIPFDVLVELSNYYHVKLEWLVKKPVTLNDLLNSKLGNVELTEQQEQLLINYIEILLGSETSGKSINTK